MYLLACSYGPDSMALFDMLYKSGVKFVCCHINYHKRDVSDYEEQSLKEYCKERNVIFEAMDARTVEEKGNFQEWARELRYSFFEKMYCKYKAVGVFVAHQQNDLIETYIMQKRRRSLVKEYGLKEVSKMRNMTIIRPLLKYSKDDLKFYDIQNQVPFSIDVSNFENKYLRNQIRHEIVEKLNEIERENYLKQIENANNEMKDFINNLHEKVDIGDELDIRTIISLTNREFQETIIQFVESSAVHVDLSCGEIYEIRKMCLSPKPNLSIKLADSLYIVKEYDVLVLATKDEHHPYAHEIKEPGKYAFDEFEIDFTNGAEDRRILESSYPITIRSPKEGDMYMIGHNLCGVNRLFIDWKMPARLRDIWPVVEDKDHNIIYIPRYRKNYVDNHTSKFCIKLV